MLQQRKFYIQLILIVGFLSSAFSITSAQERNLIKYSVEDGLSLSQISAVDQSKDGFLIVGTYGGGLSIFDGKTFKNYNTTNGLCNNVIYDLKVDKDNNIWIATTKGLSKYDGIYFENYYLADGLSGEWIYKIYIDRNNNIWFGTNKGLSRYTNGEFFNYSDNPLISNLKIFTIAEAADGKLLIGTGNGLYGYDGKEFSVVSQDHLLNENSINSLFLRGDQEVWLGTDRGLLLLKNNKLTRYNINDLPTNQIVWTINKYDDNNLIIGTDEGIRIFDLKNFYKYTFSSSGITHYKIWTIFRDSNSNLWFGGDDGLYFQSSDIFKRYNDKNYIVNAWNIYENKNGKIWIGSDAHGILEFDNKNFKRINTGGALTSNSITYMYKDSKENLWIAHNNGVTKYDGTAFHDYTRRINLEPDLIMSMTEDVKRNCFWIATYYQGVYRYGGNKTINYREESGLTNNMVYDIFIDDEDRVWAGSDHGISMFANNKFRVPDNLKWLNKYAIMKILQDKKKNLWIGTYELGLIKYNYQEKDPAKMFDTVNVNQGMNDNSIMSMAFDKNGDIWLGTNYGINKFFLNEYNRTGKKQVVSFTKGDGFPGVETIQGGILSDSKGNMWIGTTSGVIKFNPDDIKINQTPPYINITQIESFNDKFEREITYKNVLSETYYTDFQNFAYENNNLTIHFTGICFNNPNKVRYKYRLNNGEWSPATSNSSVSLSNMSPGKYTFEVISCNNNGIWNTEPALISFKIIAPFYLQLWFIIISVIFIIAAGYLLVKLRFKQIEKKNKELRERIKERLKYEENLKKSEHELIIAKEKAEKSDRLKSEFLAQMSHEIRTPVNSILSFTTLLRNELSDIVSDDLKDSFSIIESGGRRLIRTIDSILNMSQLQVGNFETRIENIDLLKIIKTLYNEFKNSASQKRLEFKINISENGAAFNEIRDEYTVTQILANLIDNSIKYTPNGFIHINIFRNKKNNTVIEVEDSGIGISKEFQEVIFTAFTQEDTGYTRKFEGSGLGLALVKKYAELNNIDISVQSEKGKGTKFSIEFLPN